jgi:hypothetical protein
VTANIRAILNPLASLKLTVTLFVLAMVLIFAGTLAQRFEGNWEVVNSYFRSFYVWIPLQVFVPEAVQKVPGTFLFPGGIIIGGLLLANLLAAHAVTFRLQRGVGKAVFGGVLVLLGVAAMLGGVDRWEGSALWFFILITPGVAILSAGAWLMFGRRCGIVMLHAGIAVILIGEAVTGLYAHEANMTIDQGSYAHFTENLRRFELAVIDPGDDVIDQVTVIPSSILRRAAGGPPLRDPQLPFEVTVERWMDNSAIAGPAVAPPDVWKNNRATEGLGKQIVAFEQPRITGVEQQTVNAPSAYITLTRDGERLGTYLVSLYFDQRQPVTVGDKTYELALRFERDYKPYTMHLIEFRHDKFVGTEIPRNFSSQIRLIDPTQNEDREVLIWMNHPLRYNGETFFQSAFKPGNTATILQVVRNPGWVLPYVSCVLVAVGMTIHFGVMVVKFTGRAMA